MNFTLKNLIAIIFVFFYSCGDDNVPKPNALLRLEYPNASYVKATIPKASFGFEVNELVTDISVVPVPNSTTGYGINLEYNTLKATLFLTYKEIKANRANFKDLVRDAENLTQKHMIKADEIPVIPYENTKHRVFGKLSEVKGNVASPAQFYVTDSVKHFLTGSLYFYARPNYDSILPAVSYMQKDIKHLIETLEWK